MSAEASPGDAAASPGDAAASVLPEDQQQDGGGVFNGLRTTRRGTVAGAAIEKEDGAGNKVEAGIIEKGSAGTVAGAMETGTSRAGTETGRSAQHIAVLAKPGRTP